MDLAECNVQCDHIGMLITCAEMVNEHYCGGACRQFHIPCTFWLKKCCLPNICILIPLQASYTGTSSPTRDASPVARHRLANSITTATPHNTPDHGTPTYGQRNVGDSMVRSGSVPINKPLIQLHNGTNAPTNSPVGSFPEASSISAYAPVGPAVYKPLLQLTGGVDAPHNTPDNSYTGQPSEGSSPPLLLQEEMDELLEAEQVWLAGDCIKGCTVYCTCVCFCLRGLLPSSEHKHNHRSQELSMLDQSTPTHDLSTPQHHQLHGILCCNLRQY